MLSWPSPDRVGDLFQVERVPAAQQGMPEIPYPSFDWIPRCRGRRLADRRILLLPPLLYCRPLLWRSGGIVGSPFGRLLTDQIPREPPSARVHRRHVRRLRAGAFVLAGAFAGLAGGLFGIFPIAACPRLRVLDQVSEVLIMTLLAAWARSRPGHRALV